MSPSRLFLAISFSLFAQVTIAQQAVSPPLAPPSRDTQALAILPQLLAANGATVLASVSDTEATATADYFVSGNPATASVIIKSKGTSMVRWEIQLPGGTQVRVLNRGRAALQLPSGKVRKLSATNTVAERVNHLPALTVLSEWTDPSRSLSYVGTASVNGQPAIAISMRFSSASSPIAAGLTRNSTPITFYFDQATDQLVKMDFQNFAEGDDRFVQKVEVFFSDYRSINGVPIPFKQDRYEDSRLALSLTLNSIAFNVGLSDSEFALPVGR